MYDMSKNLAVLGGLRLSLLPLILWFCAKTTGLVLRSYDFIILCQMKTIDIQTMFYW